MQACFDRKVAPSHRVLVVNIDYILAGDFGFVDRGRRYGVIGPLPSVDQVLAAIDNNRPSVAILYIQLFDEKSFPLADRLVDFGVPFCSYPDTPDSTFPNKSAAALFWRNWPTKRRLLVVLGIS